MPGLFTLNVDSVTEILNCNPMTVRRATGDAPFRRAARGRKHWRLSELTCGFRQPHRRGLSGGDLRELAVFDAEGRAPDLVGRWDLYVGDQPTVALHRVLTDPERARFADVRRALRRGALDALWTGAVTIPEAVWGQALCAPSVLRYVLGDDASELPRDWARAATTFGLLHAPEVIKAIPPAPRSAPHVFLRRGAPAQVSSFNESVQNV
ncbi:hypothetical protein [Solirhodobacter olei]|uniref:hypothetical protein n=1 Tax=Solirhodobacter olei TaxID=2493082 RepID=UPI000FD9F2E9|nr:hypothetical protein [Solirhodobacter olei]